MSPPEGGPPPPARASAVYPVFLGVAAGALLVTNLVSFHSVADDAYISFRYLDNWLAGEGLVYNAGERVEGYSNFLWIVLLAPLRSAGLSPERAALVLSLASLGLLLWAVHRTARHLAANGGAAAGWTALALAAGSAPLARWSASGMETTCFAALLALAAERLAAHRALTVGSSLALGLAILTRPEGVAHAALFFAAAAVWGLAGGGGLRPLWKPALVAAALPAAHLAWRLAYYGDPLPNTYYAKLGGEVPGLVASGLAYLGGYLAGGGFVLAGAALFALRPRTPGNWVSAALGAQVLLHLGFVVWAGGDYFPLHRFVVPVVPALAVLAGVGLAGAFAGSPRGGRRLLAAAVALAAAQSAAAYLSPGRWAFLTLVEVREERAALARHLAARLDGGDVLAINAAGLVPYRTGLRTIDMLGLADRHIAGTPAASGGAFKVGHLRHDGAYVCARRPDAVLTSGARLFPGTSAQEAALQAALNTYPGDRELLAACGDSYRPLAEELAPGRFLVVYLRRAEAAAEAAPAAGASTAEDWFHRGIAAMGRADLEGAIEAFRRSLELRPEHPAALTNLGFCFFDLGRPEAAAGFFERALASDPRGFNALYGLAQTDEKLGRHQQAVSRWRRYVAEAPESPWKDRARQRLFLLTGERR